jgi:hypothetical protein
MPRLVGVGKRTTGAGGTGMKTRAVTYLPPLTTKALKTQTRMSSTLGGKGRSGGSCWRRKWAWKNAKYKSAMNWHESERTLTSHANANTRYALQPSSALRKCGLSADEVTKSLDCIKRHILGSYEGNPTARAHTRLPATVVSQWYTGSTIMPKIARVASIDIVALSQAHVRDFTPFIASSHAVT